MTYAVSFLLEQGLVFASDSRTSAGVDRVSIARKMTIFEQPGDRFMTLLSSGNLAITQAVIRHLQEDLETGGEGDLFAAPSMFAATRMVGAALRKVHDIDAESMQEQGHGFNASFIMGGQVDGGEARIFMIYSAGNFIEATVEAPYLQIGETKYGKPILDRLLSHGTAIPTAAKCALLSFDSTMRSNLSVGPPLDFLCYRRDSFTSDERFQITANDPYFTRIRESYRKGIDKLFDRLPEPDWGI